MKKLLLLGGMLFSFFSGCKKEAALPAPEPADDARTVLLKTVVEQGLPSPQYKFVYNAENYVTEINYANGFSVYTLEYENKRVKKMTNTRTHGYVLYNYSNGMVNRVDEFDSTHKKIRAYELLYNTSDKLTELTRKDYSAAATGVIYKKEKMAYHPDGNLASLEQYFLMNGSLQLILTRQYSDYDRRTNVDDFYKLHGFMETFLFLPQVKLQLNNPRKEVMFSDVNTFEITNTYQFINNLPAIKSGDMKQTRGTGTGQTFHFEHQYTYY